MMLMRRKNPDGSPRSPIAFVWMLFESHVLSNGPAEKTFPIIVIEGPLASAYPWFEELLTQLQVAWAEFNGHPLLAQHHSQPLGRQPLASTPLLKASSEGADITRQQSWEHRYNQNPYLRGLSDDAVLHHGRRAIEALTPHLLIGGPKATVDQMEALMIGWSDFLCEARHRGLNLSRLNKV